MQNLPGSLLHHQLRGSKHTGPPASLYTLHGTHPTDWKKLNRHPRHPHLPPKIPRFLVTVQHHKSIEAIRGGTDSYKNSSTPTIINKQYIIYCTPSAPVCVTLSPTPPPPPTPPFYSPIVLGLCIFSVYYQPLATNNLNIFLLSSFIIDTHTFPCIKRDVDTNTQQMVL